jgi:hypothetical protein
MLRSAMLTGAIWLVCAPAATAAPITIDGVTFPQGELSFADAVASYDPEISGAGHPTAAHRDASTALGLPDYAGNADCTGDPFCTFVSLGDGGAITLQFTDNFLTGSGNSDFDLWIFEVGPDVEDTFVQVSSDGVTFVNVGKVFGATSGIDLDAFGFGTDAMFSYVRLIDDTNADNQTGITVGADIDAIGAISTVPVTTAVPEPSTLLLLASGAAVLGARRRFGARRAAAAAQKR